MNKSRFFHQKLLIASNRLRGTSHLFQFPTLSSFIVFFLFNFLLYRRCIWLLVSFENTLNIAHRIIRTINCVCFISSLCKFSCVCVWTVGIQLLSKPKYSGVEKIKTIGSTYMAATGLLRHNTTRKVAYNCRVDCNRVLLHL